MKKLLLFIPVMFFFSCEEEIEEVGSAYACTNTGCVEDAAGSYDSLEICENACSSTAYACTNTGCVEDAAGSYDSLEICESACSTTYVCTNTGCVEDPTGSYDSFESCASECCSNCGFIVTAYDSPYWEDFDPYMWSFMCEGCTNLGDYVDYLQSFYPDELSYCGDSLDDLQDNWDGTGGDQYFDYDSNGSTELAIELICD